MSFITTTGRATLIRRLPQRPSRYVPWTFPNTLAKYLSTETNRGHLTKSSQAQNTASQATTRATRWIEEAATYSEIAVKADRGEIDATVMITIINASLLEQKQDATAKVNS